MPGLRVLTEKIAGWTLGAGVQSSLLCEEAAEGSSNHILRSRLQSPGEGAPNFILDNPTQARYLSVICPAAMV